MRGAHVLSVAWHFPPIAGGGVFRNLHFVRHLRQRGLRISVLTLRPAPHHAQDPSLLRWVPPDVRVIRVPHRDPFRLLGRVKHWFARAPTGNGAAPSPAPQQRRAGLRDLVSEALQFPDPSATWILPSAWRAGAALTGDEPDLVYSSSPPVSAHLAASRLAGMFSCPLVLDLRDPWTGNPFNRPRPALLERLEQSLERRLVEEAAAVVLNTPASERQMRARYPELDHFRTITNGYEPEVFEGLPPVPPWDSRGPIELVHLGALYGLRSGRYLLQGLAELRARDPAKGNRLRIRQVGPVEHGDRFLRAARGQGIEDLVRCEPPLPYHESLGRQRGAGALLLLGVERPEPEIQVPAKLYEYLAAGRPILALSRSGGAIREILELADVPYEAAAPDAPEEIAAALERLVDRLSDTAPGESTIEPPTALRYDMLAGRLLECFEQVWHAASRERGR